jgi:hypothetical protein
VSGKHIQRSKLAIAQWSARQSTHGRLAWARTRTLLACAAVTLIAGCGGAAGNSSPPQTTAVSTQAPVTTTSAPAPAAAPGCSEFCRNAGPEGGPTSDGCQQPNGQPYSTTTPSGCLQCPARGCIAVLTTTATAANGVVPIQMRCLLSTPCQGALLMLQRGKEAAPDGNKISPTQWVGGSDFEVPANRSATVPISLTSVGRKLVAEPAGYQPEVRVQLHVYGTASTGLPTLLIHG